MNIRAFTVAIICYICGSTQPTASILLAKWTFETNPPDDVSNSSTIGNLGADSGIYSYTSEATGYHANPNTDWTTPFGNGSANSLNVNSWSENDYFQFQTKSSGYQGLTLSWEQARSSTGPLSFKLAYSINGSDFTDLLAYNVAVNPSASTWNSSTFSSGYTVGANLVTITGLDNADSVYFRIIATSLPSSSFGTVRIDDFSITAASTLAVVPEPSTFIAGALLALPFGAHGIRYLRHRKRA